MIGVEFVDAEAERDAYGSLPAAPRLAAAVQRGGPAARPDRGARRPARRVVRLLPPLTVTDEQAEAVLDRLADAVASAERLVQRASSGRFRCRGGR